MGATGERAVTAAMREAGTGLKSAWRTQGNDYRDMIHADTAAEVKTRRKAFVGKTVPRTVF